MRVGDWDDEGCRQLNNGRQTDTQTRDLGHSRRSEVLTMVDGRGPTSTRLVSHDMTLFCLGCGLVESGAMEVVEGWRKKFDILIRHARTHLPSLDWTGLETWTRVLCYT